MINTIEGKPIPGLKGERITFLLKKSLQLKDNHS